VALIGGRIMAISATYGQGLGFDGDLYLVNPRHEAIDGFPCHASLDDLPVTPDAAVVSVRRELAIDVVADLNRRGVAGAVCFTAGFAEVGGEGAALQQKLAEAAGDMALIGPNCVGAINYFDRVPVVVGGYGDRSPQRGVAIVSQSGVTAQTLVLNDRDLPVGYMLSLGNQAGIDVCDGADVALDDPRVSAVGLYIEGLDDVPAFEAVARRAIEQGVPLVVYKPGVSEKGAAAVRSHTASLAGEDRFFDALFARHGVIRTPSLPALIETLKLLTVSGPPPGPDLGVLTVSGADCSIVNDVAERHDVSLPSPAEDRSELLDTFLGGLGRAANPYDFSVGAWRNPDAQLRCFSEFAKAGFDSVMLMSSYPLHSPWSSPENWDHGVDALIAARRETGTHATYAVALAETIPDYARARLIEAGICPLQGLEEAMTAYALTNRYRVQRLERLAQPAEATRHAARAGQPLSFLTESCSKSWLRERGLPVAQGEVVPVEHAAAAARRLGHPVVVKAVADDLLHKTEAGAVAVGLADNDAVVAAAEDMGVRLAIGEVFVEQMIDDAVAELIVGIRCDPQVGYGLLLGSGGVLAELLDDAATLLLPASRDEILASLASLKAGALLAGHRGRPAGDIEAVADLVEALSSAVLETGGHVLEVDLNPVLVRPRGQGAVIVDASIGFAAEGVTP